FAQTGQHQRAERVIDHWFVVDRQQLLGDRTGNRMQACATAASQNDSLHPISIEVQQSLSKGRGTSMRVVITGAAGFIGSRFTEIMTNALLDSRVTFVEASINDKQVTDDLLRGAHAVVHFAAESHGDNSIDGARVF